MAMVECKNCTYKKNYDGKKYCHRLPPVVISNQPKGPDNIVSVFPEVEGNWFCGEGVLEA
jgi:hypothetical protein